MYEYNSRVRCGVRFLEAVKPDWRDSIDLDTLDMTNGNNCIIGQVFGSYANVFLFMDEGDAFARPLGFQAIYCEDCEHGEHEDCPISCWRMDMAWLENAWRDVLKTA